MSTMTDGAAARETRRVDQLLAHYGESHRNPRNGAIHCVAIPLIMVSLVGLIHAAHPWAAYAFVAASMVYYARIGSWVFFGTMALLSLLAIAIVQSLGGALLPASIAVFVAAWMAQFVGHKIEGKKPSFFDDLRFLLIGPLFVLGVLYRRLNVAY